MTSERGWSVMAEQLTKQQKQAVVDRGGKLLVSAAAGSGKTRVLVDRLMLYLTDKTDPANIDDFLIITFTEAAASELRGKIASKLTEKIAEDPDNKHLQKQMQRLHLAQISTIHSFCSTLLREHAYRLDLSADFRLADEKESLELQIMAVEAVLNRAYEVGDKQFLAFVDSQGLGRNDDTVPRIILDIFNKAQCHLNPLQWLDECIAATELIEVSDAGQTLWGRYLIDQFHDFLNLQIQAMINCATAAEAEPNNEKASLLLWGNVEELRSLRNRNTWKEIAEGPAPDFGTFRWGKGCDIDTKEKIAYVRNNCKDGLKSWLQVFSESNDQTLDDIRITSVAARGIVETVKQFADEFVQLKSKRRIVDFTDLEHRTLDLLVGKSRQSPTYLAEEIGARFREVMVDEYQDSNEVQDRIFSALTAKKQNCFMVGDVKQSIYQFRLADPGIFLEKYNTFVPAEDAVPGQGRKVMLSSNFRSSGGVIEAVNDVFSLCMSPRIGGLYYGEDEQLNEGIPHEPLGEEEVSLYCVNVEHNKYIEEATFVAGKIAELLDGKHLVRDGETMRPVTPDDIVILMRAPGPVGHYYQSALAERGISCVMEKSADLLQTEEITVLRSMLQVISNPLQDIPLTAVLTSRVVGVSADTLAAVRSADRNISMYEAFRNSDDSQIREFMKLLSHFRREARRVGLKQLLHQILNETSLDSIYAAMEQGDSRRENIFAFCQLASSFESNKQGDLERFLDYLDNLEEKKGFAVAEDNSAGSVQIMSIHKSKGLEFPVVFLCAMSRGFNKMDLLDPVLCDKDLGLGLFSTDIENRVKYQNITRMAINKKTVAEMLSEEMRILYVAMTRAKDRLIMVYSQTRMEKNLSDLLLGYEFMPMDLMMEGVGSFGEWVLLTALRRNEATELFAVSGRPVNTKISNHPWLIQYIDKVCEPEYSESLAMKENKSLSAEMIGKIRKGLCFTYPHMSATKVASKQTATQLKGRVKDSEVQSGEHKNSVNMFRKPSFVQQKRDPIAYGNAVHSVMQYISFDRCKDTQSVSAELHRLISEGFVSEECAVSVNAESIAVFCNTEIGKRLQKDSEVLREFKFSILDDAGRYAENIQGEQVLLQGVVDCALIQPDGITIIDFKTDRVTADTVNSVAQQYAKQVQTYCYAMERIFQKPVKEAFLYFFRINQFVKV